MKNALLALALFAFVGTASAHEGEKGAKSKKGKKETAASHCSMDKAATAGAATPSCCSKKSAATATAAKPAEAKPAAPAEKSL